MSKISLSNCDGGSASTEITFAPGATVAHILESAGYPPASYVVLHNGQPAQLTAPVADGDRLLLTGRFKTGN